ncbi:MAG: hypothetical protein JXR76_27430 [Deltaproteobacteria bacterium]|nr:hypothetical protein [Deltaproteobacteria bacterium]
MHKFKKTSYILFLKKVFVSILLLASFYGCSTASSQTTGKDNVGPSAIPSDEQASPMASGGSTANFYPHIVLDKSHSGKLNVKYRFPFEGSTVRLELKIDKALLAGAQNANKFAVSEEGKTDSDWRERFNMAFIEDTAQAPFLDALHREFIGIAKKLGLDKDRTVELITSFVQHIEYDTSRSDEARFPIETFAEKKGDCDDKSRLLVALLIRSSYNVATLHFREENHMAVGIKSNALEYLKTGYAYIESTSPSLIGFPFAQNANVKLHTAPSVHRIGKGTQKYTAATDVAYIAKTMRQLEKEIEKDQMQLDELNGKCADTAKSVEEMKKRVENAASNSAKDYNKDVKKFNSAVDKYNNLVQKQRKRASQLNKKIEIRNFIAEHAHSRYPTYNQLRKSMKALK